MIRASRPPLLATLLVVLLPAALHAQHHNAIEPEPPPGMRPPVRVRLTLKDSTALIDRAPSARFARQIHGTLVRLDTSNAFLRTRHGNTYVIPVSSVRLAERHVGVGACRTSRAAHVLCTGGGMVVGAALGHFAGRKVGHAINDPDPFSGGAVDAGPWPGRGTALLGIIGGFTANALGRDRWMATPLMPIEAAR